MSIIALISSLLIYSLTTVRDDKGKDRRFRGALFWLIGFGLQLVSRVNMLIFERELSDFDQQVLLTVGTVFTALGFVDFLLALRKLNVELKEKRG